jgi:putative transposase
MEAADIKRLRELEEENRRLKHMYAQLSLDHSDFERGAHKKALKPVVKRKLIAGIREQYQLSERRACRIMVLQRSVNRFQPQPNRDGEVIRLLLELAHGRPKQGFPKLFKRLRRLGHPWNHKRVYRVIAA